MKHIFTLSMFTLAVAVTSGSAAEARRRDQVRVDANPSEIVAAEMALARLTREKGGSVAFLETAAPDAVIFTPAMVAAAGALKSKTYPAQPMYHWTTKQVSMSCDGALAISTGEWRRDNNTSGQFVTVWQRKGDGRGRKEPLKQWKWAAHGMTTDLAAATGESAEFIDTKVASCVKPPKERPPAVVPAGTTFPKESAGGDRSLLWRVRVDPDGNQSIEVERWDGSGFYNNMTIPLTPLATRTPS